MVCFNEDGTCEPLYDRPSSVGAVAAAAVVVLLCCCAVLDTVVLTKPLSPGTCLCGTAAAVRGWWRGVGFAACFR